MKGKSLLLLCYLCLLHISCSESPEEEAYEVLDKVSWDLNGESFSKSGQWTYCDAEDFSGNFAVYGTNSIEGEGIIISIDDDKSPLSQGQNYSFDSNSIGQLIYVDQNENRWTSKVDNGTGDVSISVFDDNNAVVVEGRFSGSLISKDDGSIRVIENGFFSVRCF